MPEPAATPPGKIGAPNLEAGNERLIATWTAPNNGGSEITTYHLHHSADGGTTWSAIIALAAPAANYTITGLTNAAEYHVQARAVNAVGAGPWSESAVETLPAAATPPATVPDAPAAPTLYAGTGRIVARWAEPDDNGSAITGYELIYREGGGAWTYASGITGTDHTITGLRNGALYHVQMRAINAEGAGPWSAPVTEPLPSFPPTQTPSGTENSISLLAADNAIVTAGIANENLNLSVSLTTVESGTLDFDGGDLKVTPATAPVGVTIPTVNASTGIVTVTASTTAGTYVVYGETESGDILFAEYFSVTVSPTSNAELSAAVTTGISTWGNTGNLNYIITAAVTDMSYIFLNKDSFNGNISDWDVSSVTTMRYMFFGASAFNGDISGWDVRSVTDMSGMFNDASAFNLDLEEWKEHWTKVNNKYTVTVTTMFGASRVGRGQTNDVAFPSWYNEIIAY